MQDRIAATVEPFRGALPAGTFELLTAPGKRLRAALTIAVAQLGSPNPEAVMRAVAGPPSTRWPASVPRWWAKAATIGLQAFPRALALSTLRTAGVDHALSAPLTP